MKINSRRRDRVCSNIFFKPIRISRSSHSATRQLRPNCAFRRSIPRSPLPGERQISVSSQTCSSSFEKKEEEEEEEEAERVSARGEQTSEDKVRARPASTIFTLDTQIYLAPILNLDLRSLFVFPQAQANTPPPWFIFRYSRGILSSRSERRIQCLCIFFCCSARLLLSVSRERDFFFVRRRGEEKSASEKLYIFFSIIGSFYPPCYFVGAKNFFNTYRLLIDEVENNVEILKLISKLSDRI